MAKKARARSALKPAQPGKKPFPGAAAPFKSKNGGKVKGKKK